MAVRAVLVDGHTVDLHPGAGETPRQIIDKIVDGGLTGSAVALNDVWIDTANGGMVRYGDIRRLEQADRVEERGA